MVRPSLVPALLISLGLHGAAGVWVKVRPHAPHHATVESPDVWAGGGIDIEPAPPVEAALTSSEGAPESAPERLPPPDSQANESETSNAGIDVEACRADCAAAKRPQPPVTTVSHAPHAAPSPSSSRNPEPERPRSPPAPSPSSSTATSPSQNGSTDPDGTFSSRAAVSAPFGAAGLPPGVRYLPKAYTKALSQGSFKVAAFKSAPAGKLCEAHIALEVSAEGELGDVEYESDEARQALPAACRTMFENARRLLHTGGFSIEPKTLGSGVMRLYIEVEITDRAPSDYGDSEMHGESYEPPAAGKRGRSTFVLNSGRRVDAWVHLE